MSSSSTRPSHVAPVNAPCDGRATSLDPRTRGEARRHEIRTGSLRGAALVAAIESVPFVDRDAWTDGLLGIDGTPPDDVPELPRGSVFYLPCGVDEILTMVRDVPVTANDELVDLGAGLGRVAIVAHLASGARAVGIEIQEPLVRIARERVADLAIARVAFVHADASETSGAETLDGSVFFLYAPFNGDMLTRVLRRLEAVANRHPIVVCTVALELREIPWLVERERSNVTVAIYDSRVPGVPRP